jgi:3-oxo-5-alpha-steroid 4-dehydrogenase 3
MDVVSLTRSYFLLTAAATLFLHLVPALNRRFLAYGARAQLRPDKKRDDASKSTFLDRLASLTVPHSWFLHFYTLAITNTLLWAWQIALQTSLFLRLERSAIAQIIPNEPMTAEQVIFVATLFLCQCVRRWSECFWLNRSNSTSRMHAAHYVMGMAFYVAMNVAIWIEGSRK